MGAVDRGIRKPNLLFDAYIFDIDGTVCLGETLVPNADKVIQTLREQGKRTVFLSNNSTSSAANFAAHLTSIGIPTPTRDVVNSSMVLIGFLNTFIPKGRLLVLGEAALITDLENAGFTVTDRDASVDAVIASFDRDFTYAKLQAAFDAIRRGARFFATNNDKFRPLTIGGEPDAGAIIAAIEACTETSCEEIVGKPSRVTVDYLTARFMKNTQECIIIGDRLETDIQMGINAEISSALVLTGATNLDMVNCSDIRPTYLIDSVCDLIPRGK